MPYNNVEYHDSFVTIFEEIPIEWETVTLQMINYIVNESCSDVGYQFYCYYKSYST